MSENVSPGMCESLKPCTVMPPWRIILFSIMPKLPQLISTLVLSVLMTSKLMTLVDHAARGRTAM